MNRQKIDRQTDRWREREGGSRERERDRERAREERETRSVEKPWEMTKERAVTAPRKGRRRERRVLSNIWRDP